MKKDREKERIKRERKEESDPVKNTKVNIFYK